MLDIHHTATTPEIRKSFLNLAKQYHPDINKSPNAKKKFLEINEAYETLSNENKR